MSHLPCQERSKGLVNLWRRHLKQDMVEVYKIMKVVDKVKAELLFIKSCNTKMKVCLVKQVGR